MHNKTFSLFLCAYLGASSAFASDRLVTVDELASIEHSCNNEVVRKFTSSYLSGSDANLNPEDKVYYIPAVIDQYIDLQLLVSLFCRVGGTMDQEDAGSCIIRVLTEVYPIGFSLIVTSEEPDFDSWLASNEFFRNTRAWAGRAKYYFESRMEDQTDWPFEKKPTNRPQILTGKLIQPRDSVGNPIGEPGYELSSLQVVPADNERVQLVRYTNEGKTQTDATVETGAWYQCFSEGVAKLEN